MKKIMVTGGAGFIGSNFVRMMLSKHPQYDILVFDALTYAGNPENLKDVKDDPRLSFMKGDIRDKAAVEEAMSACDAVVNFAAETFVDRSILEPESFIKTDVEGTYVLLEQAKKQGIERFVHVSTDEVYGSVEEGSSTEMSPILPNSPYSASKAGGDLLVRAYAVTYGVPAMVTRGSNTYGPYQHPEKLIPFFITNAIEDKPLPVYGSGTQVRDWLHVLDHAAGIEAVLLNGEPANAYNVGGGNERTNMQITRMILESLGKDESLIKYVADRPGHDLRYSLDCSKLKGLGWQPAITFERGFKETVDWYKANEAWWRKVREDKEYERFNKEWYAKR